jgi:hypothetical protein
VSVSVGVATEQCEGEGGGCEGRHRVDSTEVAHDSASGVGERMVVVG